ncbi:MAG: hypothetical protein QXH12_08760 [Candidatus Caldarchaeum sp.]|uniref:Double-stranded DNA-binding protein n=1 Tax=Caldiarchaeum subterraneum TaxID=311458 RepID=A0A7C5Q4U7_CALS0
MSDEDIELKRLQLKRMMKLMSQKVQQEAVKQQTAQDVEPSPLEIVRSRLGERGGEVLSAALEQYPQETMAIVNKLAELIKAGKITEPIDGGELYSLFRSLGLRVKIDTKIMYVKRGEAKDLRELFR